MIIKSLILSQVTHLLSMVFTPSYRLEKLDKILFEFLWHDKPARVKRQTIIAETCNGGLKMPDVFAFHSAQKVMWIKCYLTTRGKWKELFQQLRHFNNYQLKHKLSKNDLKCENKFHHQALDCWFKLKSNPPNSTNEILNEYVFLNKFIQIDHNSIIPSNLVLQSSESLMDLKINDLLNANGKLMLPIDLREKKNWKVSILHVNSLSAIPRTWISKIEKSDSGYNEIPQSSVIIKHCPKQKISEVKSQDLYWELLRNTTMLPTAVSTWIDLFPFSEQVNWAHL